MWIETDKGDSVKAMDISIVSRVRKHKENYRFWIYASGYIHEYGIYENEEDAKRAREKLLRKLENTDIIAVDVRGYLD